MTDLNFAVQTFLNNNPPYGLRLNIGVAVDGSDVSERAVKAAVSLVHQHRADKLHILHVFDRNKTYLPIHLKPQHLQHEFENKARAIYKVKPTFVSLVQCKSTRELLGNCVGQHSCL